MSATPQCLRPAGPGTLPHRMCPVTLPLDVRLNTPKPSHPTASPDTPPSPSQAAPCPGPVCILPSRPRSPGGTGLSGHCIHTAHSGRGRVHSRCACSLGHSPRGQRGALVSISKVVPPAAGRPRTPLLSHLDSHWLLEGRVQAQLPIPASPLRGPPLLPALESSGELGVSVPVLSGISSHGYTEIIVHP